MSALVRLDPVVVHFPPVEAALEEPNGLLAVGGDLRPARLLAAYRRGIFPWYGDRQPILWWSPDPRAVLFPGSIHISRSLRKTLKRSKFRVTMDLAFRQVIAGCAGPRRSGGGTWITAEMRQAYVRLYELGHAHSVECWREGELAGGLYGVCVGRVFSGESMFSRYPDASKVALVALARQLERWGYRLIDCQLHSEHLARLGAVNVPRSQFVALLQRWASGPEFPDAWHLEDDVLGTER
jgi:leucyl/phenylalanyl-tRNA---protein transferase